MQRPLVIDRFFTRAPQLRAAYDRRFADPLRGRSDRFVWDYWHVPGEYTLLRTPAHLFFPQRLYQDFHRHLVEWGRANLGCHDVSPPWLSCYVEGCRQEAHRDVPHGPLAFVFSLTQWRRRPFTGGETFIELGGAVKQIPSQFNRLLVFNPADRHGVRQVRGTHDPRFGRLVIHGWFVNPRPFWYGPLKAPEVSMGVEAGLAPVLGGGLNLGQGLISYHLRIAPSGRVVGLRNLVNTLKGGRGADLRLLHKALAGMQFSKKRRATDLTLPLLCE